MNFMWITLAIFLIVLICERFAERLGIDKWYRLSSIGWICFSVYWLSSFINYLNTDDYVNMLLTLMAAVFGLIVAVKIITNDKKYPWENITLWATISIMIIFPFYEIPILRDFLMRIVANHTLFILSSVFNTAGKIVADTTIMLNGFPVSIVIGCTAIESIAFFAGLILCLNAPLRKKIIVLLIFAPVIYIANLFRNAFAIYAYGNQLFQFGIIGTAHESFFWAHNVIAKIYSFLIVAILAYLTFKIFPEFLTMIEDIINNFKKDADR